MNLFFKCSLLEKSTPKNIAVMRKFLLILAGFFCYSLSFAQTCPENSTMVIVKITTDKWGRETSWMLSSIDTVYGSVDKNEYGAYTVDTDTFCVPDYECLTFMIYDGFGDGITEGGGYELRVDTQLVAEGSEFGLSKAIEINCAPGTSCLQAIEISEGLHKAPRRNSWYTFTPDTIGTFTISTCGLNECDTRIWVYDRCESFMPGESEGFIFFDDNTGNCGFQAVVNAYFNAGQTYLIRIDDSENDCSGDSIGWSLEFRGPVIGCTEPNSCNYNPLATIDDGSCLPQDDPRCPNGPDLAIKEEILLASIEADSIFNDDECLIQENCVLGFGWREIIRFTTRFENIGELDYYIGEPTLDNNQFTFDRCHNHFHYDNYAEYILFDENGVRIPGGFKSGFCVIDLICKQSNNKYGCANMGLTAGCFDEYSSELDCQWVDVTDIPDGNIVFVARINWGNWPDKLGRVEKNLLNNWAQACLTLDRSSGQLEITINEDCPTVLDCEGIPYGSTEMDCTGVCGGQQLIGDIDQSNQQDIQDAQSYISMILEEGIATPCNDLNTDGRLTIYDAALLADCANFGSSHFHPAQGAHNHCYFPAGILNSEDTVSLTITEINFEEKYVDIAIKNPFSEVVAYQFQMTGITIKSIENLVDANQYPAMLQANIGRAEIIGISLQDSTIWQSRDFHPLIRIHYLDITDDYICLDNIADIVNRNYQQVVVMIEENNCVNTVVSNIGETDTSFPLNVYPNPFKNITTITFPNSKNDNYNLIINDLTGRKIKAYRNVFGNAITISSKGMASGIYYFQLVGKRKTWTGKLVLE